MNRNGHAKDVNGVNGNGCAPRSHNDTEELIKKGQNGSIPDGGHGISETGRNGHAVRENLSPESAETVNSWYCVFTMIVTMTSIMMSVTLGFAALNPITSLLIDFFNETHQGRYDEPITTDVSQLLLALTFSIFFVGGLIGAWSIGFFRTYLSPKWSMITINIINTVAVMCTSFIGNAATSYELLVVGRLLMGFASGVAMNLVPMVISETSTKGKAPFYLSLIGVTLAVGGPIGITFGLKMILGNEDRWPVLLALPAMPSILYLLATPWLPETPSHLILLNKKGEAIKILEKLRKSVSYTLLQQEVAVIEEEQKAKGQAKHSMSLRDILWNGDFRWQLTLVVMVFVASQLCGINAIGMYSTMIFKDAGFEQEQATFASLIVQIVLLLVSLVGSMTVDRWGPRRLTIACLTIMASSMALLTLSLGLSEVSWMPYVSVVAVCVFMLAWGCGPNVVLFPLVTTLTTEATRAASFSLGGTIFWILSWFVSFLAPYLQTNIPSYAQIPWMIFNILFAILFYFYIPETNGKTPEQIQKEIHASHRRRDSNITTL